MVLVRLVECIRCLIPFSCMMVSSCLSLIRRYDFCLEFQFKLVFNFLLRLIRFLYCIYRAYNYSLESNLVMVERACFQFVPYGAVFFSPCDFCSVELRYTVCSVDVFPTLTCALSHAPLRFSYCVTFRMRFRTAGAEKKRMQRKKNKVGGGEKPCLFYIVDREMIALLATGFTKENGQESER